MCSRNSRKFTAESDCTLAIVVPGTTAPIRDVYARPSLHSLHLNERSLRGYRLLFWLLWHPSAALSSVPIMSQRFYYFLFFFLASSITNVVLFCSLDEIIPISASYLLIIELLIEETYAIYYVLIY